MTWVLVGILAMGTLALKVLGPLVAGGVQPPRAFVRVIELLTPGAAHRPRGGAPPGPGRSWF